MLPVINQKAISDSKHAVFTAKGLAPDSSEKQAVSTSSLDVLDTASAGANPVKKTVFARMNESWFTKESENTHAFFQKKPDDWQAYHATFRQARQTWEATPADELIRLYAGEENLTIGDFGCGEGMISEALQGRHVVHSFDHIAANANVTACDIAHVPLADCSLDVAIFSLALMGKNFTAYIDEAHRTLKKGGKIEIMEMSRRFTDKEGFLAGLTEKGFEVKAVQDLWKFTHITAVKSSDTICNNVIVF